MTYKILNYELYPHCQRKNKPLEINRAKSSIRTCPSPLGRVSKKPNKNKIILLIRMHVMIRLACCVQFCTLHPRWVYDDGWEMNMC